MELGLLIRLSSKEERLLCSDLRFGLIKRQQAKR